MRLPVRRPFRLDLTVDALRRLAANAVDVAGDDGTYYRAVRDECGAALLAVRAGGAGSVDVRASGRDAERWLPTVRRLLGTNVDLREWYARSAGIPWLGELTRLLRGLKPPRYPTLWEACAHAIVFQQISIHAGAAIMRRLVETLAEEVVAGGVRGRIFPEAERWLDAKEAALRSAGLSANKFAHLRTAAAAFADGSMSEARLGPLATEDAATLLCTIRGIGPWSASVALLRGMGRLDVFPMRDSGVARSLSHAGGGSLDEVLEVLGPVRGMLYFHLLLARLHLPAAQPERSPRRSTDS
jgi:DNA-3-methyladenine glycosylase II